jgi:malto-oligosyltrehalose synthase/4-alpha-glucanotransferase
MYNPVSTYRIQFNKDFSFRNFSEHIHYFSSLGPGTIYASPVFSAVPGSMHGYDITDPHSFNPEIGTADDFNAIIRQLKLMKIGWLQDIVPNHMALNPGNYRLMDVLEHGRNSEYANYFDIDFDHPDFSGKIILPFLGSSTEEALENGEIQVSLKNGRILFQYFDFIFPVNDDSVISILKNEMNPHLKLLANKIKKHELTNDQALTIVEAFNEDISILKELLTYQHYKLAHWKEINTHLNYRRFFTINSLICLRIDQDEVFDDYHSFIGELVRKNNIQGLRIDHIDGLKDPSKYSEKLRLLTGDETYIIAEKILEQNEALPGNWPLQGSTGYDFLATVNNLLTYSQNCPALQKYYNRLCRKKHDLDEIIYQKKKLILNHSMQGEWDNLTRMFFAAGFARLDNTEYEYETIHEAIGEFLLACPRYKLYSNSFPLSDDDARIIREIIQQASERNPHLRKSLLVLQKIFLGQTEAEKTAVLKFFQRCMQFTVPIMAKGIEDTAMYDYNCFVSHNEVGDSLKAQGITTDEFHTIMRQRQMEMPFSMNATSTHDTKRGEDVRARLNVISEIPEEWISNVEKWRKENSSIKELLKNKEVPDVNEEYFIYQTVTGIMPFNGKTNEHFLTRVEAYLVKALREAKVNSNWDEPDESYEKLVCEFVKKILKPGSNFLKTFLPFHQKISTHGAINSLVQLTLKSTCPGIPDFYQGTELWDLSMVDPDNRRPVDFVKMEQMLSSVLKEEAQCQGDFLKYLYDKRDDGQIKMWFSHKLMEERRKNPELFVHGAYCPLTVTGKYRENILAFARYHLNTWYIIVVPLFTAILSGNSITVADWGDTKVLLPELAPEKLISVLNGSHFNNYGYLPVSEILKIPLPSVLKGINEESKRKAGILLHITSLPGGYGTGDIGNNAFRFVDFLIESGQTYWQILPVNPVTGRSGYSPYSTSSAFAGNILLIDPEWMVKDRLISGESLHKSKFNVSVKADFKKTESFRMKLIDEAYLNFNANTMPFLWAKFNQFCISESYWLDDFVLFNILKRELKGKSWSKWPEKLRDRDINELTRCRKKYKLEADKEKFGQFLFFIQWESLKSYANNKGIKIIGDMSFYVDYESADVWQNPEVFKLDSRKKMIAVGGAPPDYFSNTGQLWNMPVYNWEYLKNDGFSWWLRRIYKNMKWFDVLRFDHFRGFSGFWEVPAGEKTAVNGRWVSAPGNDLFQHLKKELKHLPFMAEDLGDIDDKVYELRDTFGLPGMKVLQFAFNDTLERSIHLPHNFNINSIVYTGTHDNNTTKGWYENELNNNLRNRAGEYLNRKLSSKNIQGEFIRLAYASVSNIAVIPIQDILGLGEEGRFNNPSGGPDNWKWKLTSLDPVLEKSGYLVKLAKMYWRI